MENISFLGRGFAFPLDFSEGNAKMSSAEEDIEESLYILLGTYPGERIMQGDYGCRLRDFCFKSYNASFVAAIKNCVCEAILLYEPRIDVDDIDVYSDDEISGKILVKIFYTIRATNSRRNLVYPFYLNEATEANV